MIVNVGEGTTMISEYVVVRCASTKSRGRIKCFCQGRRFTCPACKRFVPECYGAADEQGAVCDDCYVPEEQLPAQQERYDQNVAMSVA